MYEKVIGSDTFATEMVHSFPTEDLHMGSLWDDNKFDLLNAYLPYYMD